MLPFQERKKVRRILYSKTMILVLLVVAILVARGTWQVYTKASIARAKSDESAQKLKEIQERNSTLEASLAHLKSNNGLEDEVRQKFNVARPDEEVVMVIDENSKKSENGANVSEETFWQKILSFFKL
ncbi:MAG: hypothetical protein PHS95_02650 [Candidatus Pacebacteria bacterium]|nr:hypothetical protein [Candidatus Paceibacterota bacterium]